MATKLICCCLLVAALLGCSVDAQQTKPNPQLPLRYPGHSQLPKPAVPVTSQHSHQSQYSQPSQQSHQSQPSKQSHQSQPSQQSHQSQHSQQSHQSQYSQQSHQFQNSKDPTNPTEVFHTCEVANYDKIQCGSPDISSADCEAISCCFDGRMCYYGKFVTLQCTKDGQFIVVVARDATLPHIDLESISFVGRESVCNPVGTTSAFAIYQFPVTACGSVMKEEPGVIIYENKMSSSYEVAIGPHGAITRDSYYTLYIQCRYVGTTIEALVIEAGLISPPPPIAAPGPLRVELRLASGQCTIKGCVEEDVAYNSFYSDADYPVTKLLKDPVYVEVRMLERTDPNLVLTLGRCWATSNSYPHSFPQWDLLIDGCPYREDHYLTSLVNVGPSSGLMFPSHHRRFIFKMFTFVAGGGPSKSGSAGPEDMTPLNEKVYIHCDVAVCKPSLGNNCEPRCFRQRREVVGAIKKGDREKTPVVTSGEIIFTKSSDE